MLPLSFLIFDRYYGTVRSVLIAATLLLYHTAVSADTSPNFVFILTDDIGYGDLSCYGHPYAMTPNIDRMASEGTKYTQFNVNGNVCPHTRAGFMTGRNPSWFPNYTADYGFMGAMTITKLLKSAGYTTGHIGKWNIGSDPEVEAIEYGIDDLRRTGDLNGDPRGREGLRFDDAISFIEENKDVPFYLNLWVYAVHTPIEAPDEIVQMFENVTVDRSDFDYWMQSNFDAVESMGGDVDEAMRLYLADIYALDLNIGRLLDKLDEFNLTENTVVVFTSDNGPASPLANTSNIGYAGGLRGGKHTYYEGGVRVPFIVRWPDHTPMDEVNDSLMFGIDWLPTVCSLAGCDIPWNLVEGEDMSDVFYGAERNRQTPMLWRGIGENVNNYFSTHWIRYGPWKLVEHDKELYNLADDPGERVNLYNVEPNVVAALVATLQAWDATLPTDHARLPSEPFPFNPLEPVVHLEIPDLNSTGDDDGSDFGPDCVIFETTPFTAMPHQYCLYYDTTEENIGGYGTGPVDVGSNLSTENQQYCESNTYIRNTEAGEYVAYAFEIDGIETLNITIKVASLRSRDVTLELLGHADGYYAIGVFESNTGAWTSYTALSWIVEGVPAGSHLLQVTFAGFTNLCAISVERMGDSHAFVGPDCTNFAAIPFTAMAHQYCQFNDTTEENIGGYGSGSVDIGSNLSTENQQYCGSNTYIRDTEADEFVEYVFNNDAEEQNLNITLKVASKRSRSITLELLGHDAYYMTGVVESNTGDWDAYTALSWTVDGVPAGNHRLRIAFAGFTNLCSVSVESIANDDAALVGPDCTNFDGIPFTAMPHQYCRFYDTREENVGGNETGVVDIGSNLSTENQQFCESNTYIRDTVSGEFVEYTFDIHQVETLSITVKVASRRSRDVTLELLGQRDGYYAKGVVESDTGDFSTYTSLSWTVPEVPAGNHRLRVTFAGFTNLCSVRVDFGHWGIV